MRILQLNVWDGRVKGALINYLSENQFDAICMQEAVWLEEDDGGAHSGFFAMLSDIQAASGLKYSSCSPNWSIKSFLGYTLYQGNVILSREKIVDEKKTVVFDGATEIKTKQDFYDHCYTAQMVKLESGLNIANYHGYWQNQPLGNEDTVKAMKNAVSLVKAADGPLVMCGDLNIVHEAPAMRELDFLRDLTEEYHVDNTLAGLKYGGKVACDHILVSKDITVSSFEVVDKIISDHKGLILEI